MALTRRQRNDLFETLANKGVDPAECRLDASGARIVHLPTNSDFRIEDSDGYRIWWHVIDGPDHGGLLGSRCGTWFDVLERLGYWADQVRYVTETPDLWAGLRQAPQMLTRLQATDASNARFTTDEQAEISTRLAGIKQLVREKFELTDEQLATIDQRLDDAEEASKRLGRKDWLMAFYGGLISTAITDAVPSGVIQTILATVVHGIGHIFGIGGLPPIITT